MHPDPTNRYQEVSEFVWDLRHPNSEFLNTAPLIERNPLMFWKCVSFALAIFVLLLGAQLAIR